MWKCGLFDLNPFIDIGIAPEQSLFADALMLLMCLFRDQPADHQRANKVKTTKTSTAWSHAVASPTCSCWCTTASSRCKHAGTRAV
jgi:gamma-glutamylcysteine synthetase